LYLFIEVRQIESSLQLNDQPLRCVTLFHCNHDVR